MRRISAAMLLVVCSFCGSVLADPVQTRGKIDAVTVYRGQALVTRIVDVAGPAGLNEIVVTELPQNVVPGSLFAESGEAMQVRSVLFRERAVSQDVREEVRKLDDQLQDLANQITAIERTLDTIVQNSAYLGKLEAFTAATAQTELTHGVLNAETLEKLTNLIFTSRTNLAKERLANEQQMTELKKKVEFLTRQRSEVTGGASNTAREAVLLVDVTKPGAQLKLNYLVDRANWTPSYTLNARTGENKVSVIYQAAVSQMSGEDWKDVTMTLSTATPSVVAKAPTLESLTLALAPRQQIAGDQSEERYAQELRVRRNDAVKGLNSFNGNTTSGTITTGGQLSINANGGSFGNVQVAENSAAARSVADEVQRFELTSQNKALARTVNKDDEVDVITVNYALASRTTLQSRSDQQLVSISTIEMIASFYKIATPVLTPYVYDEAQLKNEGQTVLLAGPSVAYMNGQFVGHGQIPTTAIGGLFVAGFGIDTSLHAMRELVERTETMQGGNVVKTFDYRLSVENFSDKPAAVRLMDRMPKPDGNTLKPTLVSSSVEPSKDAEFERTQKKQGILRFDLTVPAHAMNGTASTVEYKLTIEHDRNMAIIGGDPVRK